MQSEDLDKLFRKRIDQLQTPPPQTGWRPEHSWEKLSSELEALSPKEQAPKRLAAWWYVAAAILVLMLPMGVLLDRLNRQEEALAQLKKELAGGKTVYSAKKALQKNSETQAPTDNLVAKTTNVSASSLKKERTSKYPDQSPQREEVKVKRTLGKVVIEQAPVPALSLGQSSAPLDTQRIAPTDLPAVVMRTQHIKKDKSSQRSGKKLFVFDADTTIATELTQPAPVVMESPRPRKKKLLFLNAEKEPNEPNPLQANERSLLIHRKHK